jgi:hypothetical protein
MRYTKEENKGITHIFDTQKEEIRRTEEIAVIYGSNTTNKGYGEEIVNALNLKEELKNIPNEIKKIDLLTIINKYKNEI